MDRRGFLRMFGMAPAAAVAAAVPGALAAPLFYTATGLAAAEFVPAVVLPGNFVWRNGTIASQAYNWRPRLSGWPVYDPRE